MVISGWALADSRNLQLDIVHYAAVSGLPSANFCPRLFRLRNRSVPHVGGGQRADETLSLTVSIRVKGDHSACFAVICRCMSIQNDYSGIRYG
ncbi:hypothetical protein BPORC_1813 [Bifidobacterium porcinum]|nr:hypothetical protein BPORC_1813 [Bifidobacterium porcinum]